MSETGVLGVKLGVLDRPGWWLTQFRQAVCARTHWDLAGSLLFAQPVEHMEKERPPQVLLNIFFKDFKNHLCN